MPAVALSEAHESQTGTNGLGLSRRSPMVKDHFYVCRVILHCIDKERAQLQVCGSRLSDIRPQTGHNLIVTRGASEHLAIIVPKLKLLTVEAVSLDRTEKS